jgi:hypothetical protein
LARSLKPKAAKLLEHRFEIWAISFLADRRQTFTEESESCSLNTSLDCNFVKIQKAPVAWLFTGI